MATTQELTVMLAQAEKAYHDLMTGRATKVVVDQNGERLEIQVANSSRLAAYIMDLKRQLGLATVPGPMRVYL